MSYAWCVCRCGGCQIEWTIPAVRVDADPPGRWTKPAEPQRCVACQRVADVIGLCAQPLPEPVEIAQEGLWE